LYLQWDDAGSPVNLAKPGRRTTGRDSHSLVQGRSDPAVVLASQADLGDLRETKRVSTSCGTQSNDVDGSGGWLTSAEVKLEMANVLNLPCLCISSMAFKVSWKGVPLSAACAREFSRAESASPLFANRATTWGVRGSRVGKRCRRYPSRAP